jgi:hypothetical protein
MGGAYAGELSPCHPTFRLREKQHKYSLLLRQVLETSAVLRPVPNSASMSTSTHTMMPDTPTARMTDIKAAFRLSVTLGAMPMA